MTTSNSRFRYPRRRTLRSVLRLIGRAALSILADFEVEGRENIPKEGPLLVVGNHFSYIDPVAMVSVSPWPLEFLGGFNNPGAPSTVTWIPEVWGYFPVFRGTVSRDALRAGEAVLAQRGVLGVFPEAGSWAAVLRPARPGAAFLAARTGARILPIGFDGLTDIFTRIREGHRSHVVVRVGEPFGPFTVTGRGRERRKQLDEIGHEIMRRIADLIPPERRGHYSDDPAIREAAKGTEIYPWATATEYDFSSGDHLKD